jgi:hypothetical protein
VEQVSATSVGMPWLLRGYGDLPIPPPSIIEEPFQTLHIMNIITIYSSPACEKPRCCNSDSDIYPPIPSSLAETLPDTPYTRVTLRGIPYPHHPTSTLSSSPSPCVRTRFLFPLPDRCAIPPRRAGDPATQSLVHYIFWFGGVTVQTYRVMGHVFRLQFFFGGSFTTRFRLLTSSISCFRLPSRR